MNCIDMNSKWSKMLLRRKTFESTQNYKSDQIGIQNEQKMMSYVANHSKPLNYKSDQNIMTFTDLISKTSKQRRTTKISKVHELHRFDVQTIKTTQNYKSDQITMNLHRFDVQTIKNVELRRKPFKTSKLQKWTKYNDLHRYDVKSDQYTMTCIDLASKRSKISRYVAKLSKQHKTAKVIKLQWIASI